MTSRAAGHVNDTGIYAFHVLDVRPLSLRAPIESVDTKDHVRRLRNSPYRRMFAGTFALVLSGERWYLFSLARNGARSHSIQFG